MAPGVRQVYAFAARRRSSRASGDRAETESTTVSHFLRFAAIACLAAALPAQAILSTDGIGGSGPTSKTVVRDAAGTLYAVSVVSNAGTNSVTLFFSFDDGASWFANPAVVNDATSGLSGSATTLTNHCALAIDDVGTLHVLWASYYYPSYYKQYYRQIVPSTSTYSAIVDLSAALGSAVGTRTAAMDIAVDALNTVWIVAHGATAWVERLIGSTTPYASTLAFTTYGAISASASAQTTRIAVDAFNVVHCAYYRNTGAGIYEHRAYTPGTGWGVATTIGNIAAPNDFYGNIAADAYGNVYALIAKDTGPAGTWQYVLRTRDVAGVWSAETSVFSVTAAQYTGIANYFICALAVDEDSGLVSVVHRDLAGAGGLRVAQKGNLDAAFTYAPNDLTAGSTGLHAYYMPTVRGSLFPAFNRTGGALHLAWTERFPLPPYNLVFKRHRSSTLTLNAPAVVGTTTSLAGRSASEPNAAYAAGFALTNVPPIVLPDLRIVPLTDDFLLTLSLTPGNGIFTNTLGLLDAGGNTTVGFAVPAIPALVGFPIYGCLVSADPVDPTGIGSISPALTIIFQ